MAKFGRVTNMQIDEESNLDIFEMSIGTNKPTKDVVNKELLMFRKFQVNVKDIECPLKWWARHEYLIPIVAFPTHHILGMVDSQIKIKRIFSS
jgi:hypothetical protein